ncbi:large subunit ribosomal protein L15 [Marchantia polymorpha subsp. ruderalis]|uniref:Large ribosomal subunit protein uL15/eL18 domain-containing protein n=2 Tax=Marchantia polymorpha TaxID=3197 RepID=A0A176WPF5_MARPO|nr:hypothetical protein AXG93_1864s1060 [Marchantia polymorpha subsp. ruderalis]PTQ36184.1 hypothetical protein MARPO_0065s0007 [Marchantia polymorpha]BBM99771.1 hypothetical protein Mp_1g23700 [Marchantia polymorpha subsp. ruderalis]|eukprot:PTQ36184.1 hypothetical protein MARPO_0065s0007 [Marchantia polymorpha]
MASAIAASVAASSVAPLQSACVSQGNALSVKGTSISSAFVTGQKLQKCLSAAPLRKRTAVVKAQAQAQAEVEIEDVTERFRLGNLSPQPGSRKRNKRKGRGIAAGQGASCGFGMRGQKSRSGSGVRPGFEGGQMPLYRRLPKLKGIAGGMGAGLPKFVTVNLCDIAEAGFEEGEEVTLENLVERRVINPSGRDSRLRLKVLADGELDTKLTIKAGSFSAAAREKLEAAGCTLVDVPGRKKWLSESYMKNQARADEYFAKKRAGAEESS